MGNYPKVILKEGGSPLEQCLREHFLKLEQWARESSTDCFRLYDREIEGFPLSIDYYGGRYCIHYFASGKAQPDPAEQLIEETDASLKRLFGASKSAIFWKTRQRFKSTRQYEKASNNQQFFTVSEHGAAFKINLSDYVDTGLFLDHRPTRMMAASLCKGKRMLNLFAYTCSFSVHAALAGASLTKSVDLSNTYTAWGRENFALNRIPPQRHPIIRADCMVFLAQETRTANRYDLIIIDPPTISRSKKMQGMFDIQKDYSYLILQSLKLLAPGGIILFSTNSRKFSFEGGLFPGCSIEEITSQTIPRDFNDPFIHRCWKLSK